MPVPTLLRWNAPRLPMHWRFIRSSWPRKRPLTSLGLMGCATAYVSNLKVEQSPLSGSWLPPGGLGLGLRLSAEFCLALMCFQLANLSLTSLMLNDCGHECWRSGHRYFHVWMLCPARQLPQQLQVSNKRAETLSWGIAGMSPRFPLFLQGSLPCRFLPVLCKAFPWGCSLLPPLVLMSGCTTPVQHLRPRLIMQVLSCSRPLAWRKANER